MTTNDTQITVGTKIRSFDFCRKIRSTGNVYGLDIEGTDANFVEGIVTSTGTNGIAFTVTRQVMDGEDATEMAKANGLDEAFTFLRKRGQCRLSYGGLQIID